MAARIWLSLALAACLIGSWLPSQRFESGAAEPSSSAPVEHPSAADVELFEKRVRPLLVSHCHKCHGPDEQKGGLRLDSRAAALAGGDSGPAVVPGRPEEGFLVDAVSYGDVYQMPPTGKLPDDAIAVFRRWVEIGAPWPDEPAAKEPAAPRSEFNLAERARHWSFQPLSAAMPPVAESPHVGWPRSPIDRFILSGLARVELAPAPAADKRALVRRATFDLIGLPPAPEEIEAFLADGSSEAFARVVDRLLDSPHFGERWARHWLDLVRYAETRGHEFDYVIPNAYQYRDYVIRAFNADLPYDQFVVEHIAGDLVDPPRLDPEGGFNESILGTGFWFLGEEVHSPVDIRGDETERIDNKLDCMTKTFLGLTVACARCHDHKFDAISTRDYYALAGFLLSSSYRQAPFESLEQNRRIAERLEQLEDGFRPAIARAVADAAQPTLARLADYLLAARDAALEGPVSTVAQRHQLDPGLLARWVDQIQQAKENPHNLLYPWALVATGPQSDEPATAAALAALIEGWRARTAAAGTALDQARILVDYSRPATGENALEWLQDGLAFGLGPVRPGDVRLGADLARPIAKVHCRGAAQRDPSWDVVEPAPGTETESGRLNWRQSGRMLRTPTFTLGTGKLFYLIRGSGHAYAAVDSHRLNQGPLHGALVREWKADEQYQWIEHNLTDYGGHRLHIEFSPRLPGDVAGGESADLAIVMAVEADQVPGDVVPPNSLLFEAIAACAQGDAADLAREYQRLFVESAERLANDSIRDSPHAAAYAELADWLIQRPHLWNSAGSEAEHAIAAAAAPFIQRQAELRAGIRRLSHTAPAMLDGSAVDEQVLVRGNHRTPGETVPRRFLEAVAGSDQPSITGGSGRLELARRMTAESNPFLARVMVNRMWQHLFGRGLVASADNFGVLGEPPTHPELLDYLAQEFISDGWSIKRLIRRMMLSQTYQMSSRPNERGQQVDPDNRLWHRMPVRRLEAEAIRDAILAVTGRLDRRLFGPSVEVHLTPFMEGRGRPESGPLDGAGRRSLYTRVRRNFLPPMLLAFDFPVPFTTMGRRGTSNVPAQALTLMNSPFVVEQTQHWAARIAADSNRSLQQKVTHAYVALFAREPSGDELDEALAFLDRQGRQYGSAGPDERAWADLCHVLMNVKEFIFVN